MATDTAMAGSGRERIENDFYPTPAWITEMIVAFYKDQFPEVEEVLEPFAGTGAMTDVLTEAGYRVHSFDLVDRGRSDIIHGVDFFKANWNHVPFDAIISNPPYGDLARKSIEHALNLIDAPWQRKYLTLVLRNEFDCQKGMRPFFAEHPFFHSKVVLNKRPLWVEPKPGEKAGSPRHNYAFYTWTNQNARPTKLFYGHPSENNQVYWG